MHFFTIGAYNTGSRKFFEKLIRNGIDTFCDIRQRRGVRGAEYAFVNSNRLQNKLSELGIRYEHVTGLAPSEEIRQMQKKIDKEKGDAYRKRETLGVAFIEEYSKKILNKFDFEAFRQELRQKKAKNIVLFCVEEKPDACHRSIVAGKLKADYGYVVTHL